MNNWGYSILVIRLGKSRIENNDENTSEYQNIREAVQISAKILVENIVHHSQPLSSFLNEVLPPPIHLPNILKLPLRIYKLAIYKILLKVPDIFSGVLRT